VICISEPGGKFEIWDSNEDDAMGQDAVYFYNYQQDITYGTTCHLEISDLSLADDGRGFRFRISDWGSRIVSETEDGK